MFKITPNLKYYRPHAMKKKYKTDIFSTYNSIFSEKCNVHGSSKFNYINLFIHHNLGPYIFEFFDNILIAKLNAVHSEINRFRENAILIHNRNWGELKDIEYNEYKIKFHNKNNYKKRSIKLSDGKIVKVKQKIAGLILNNGSIEKKSELIFEVKDKENQQKFKIISDPPYSVNHLIPLQDNRFASVTRNIIKIWNLETRSCDFSFREESVIEKILQIKGGQLVIVTSNIFVTSFVVNPKPYTVKMLDLTKKKCLNIVKLDTPAIFDICELASGVMLIILQDKTIKKWDLRRFIPINEA